MTHDLALIAIATISGVLVLYRLIAWGNPPQREGEAQAPQADFLFVPYSPTHEELVELHRYLLMNQGQVVVSSGIPRAAMEIVSPNDTLHGESITPEAERQTSEIIARAKRKE